MRCLERLSSCAATFGLLCWLCLFSSSTSAMPPATKTARHIGDQHETTSPEPTGDPQTVLGKRDNRRYAICMKNCQLLNSKTGLLATGVENLLKGFSRAFAQGSILSYCQKWCRDKYDFPPATLPPMTREATTDWGPIIRQSYHHLSDIMAGGQESTAAGPKTNQ